MGGSIVVSRQLFLIIALLLLSATATARRPGSGGSNRPGSGGSNRPGSGGGNKPGSGGGSNKPGGGIGGQHTYPPSNGWSGTNYRPPQNIQHGSNSFPVSQTPPPSYVYNIRDSGSRYNNLLTGLALWNLGRRPSTIYRGEAGEVCMFRLRNNGTTEDRRINCRTISSFIWDWENQGNTGGNSTTGGGNGTGGGNSTIGSGNGSGGGNSTTGGDNSTSGGNSTTGGGNDTDGGNNTIDAGGNSNVTLIDALDDKGETILVTPGMSCYIIRTLRSNTWTKSVDCELLQLYTANSWRNGVGRLAPAVILLVFQVLFVQIWQ